MRLDTRQKGIGMSRFFFHRDSSVVRMAEKKAPAEEKFVYSIKPTSRPARTETERFVLQLLDARNAIAYNELLSRLSSFLYKQELKIGGWALDIGVFGASLFVSEACRELELGKQILWDIDFRRKDSDGLLSNLSRNERSALPGDWRQLGGGAQNRRATGGGSGSNGV
jgi:hypothetical protein